MDAVLETYGADDFALWPVADLGTDRFLPLSGRLSATEVGTAMAILVGYNQDASDDPVTEPGAASDDCAISPRLNPSSHQAVSASMTPRPVPWCGQDAASAWKTGATGAA